jgi:hypothetical protein
MRLGRLCAVLVGLGLAPACALFPDVSSLSGSTSSDAGNVTDASGTPDATPDAVADAAPDAKTDADSSTPHTITWRSTTTAFVLQQGAGLIAVARPSTVASGDVLVAGVAMGNSGNSAAPVFTAPSGWSLVRRLDSGIATTLAVYWHVAGASEPATYTWSFDLPIEGEAWVSDYAGVDTVSPVDVETGVVQANSATSYATPSLKTIAANTLVLGSFASHGGSAATWTAPPSTTTRASLNNGTSRSALAVEEAFAPAGTTVGPWTATVDQAQDYALVHLMALRPAP